MPTYAELAGVKVGDGYPVRIIGAINVSPESFYKSSVRTDPGEVASLAIAMADEGADIIDIGGMSTAPYLQTEISEEEEARRLSTAIRAVKEAVDLPVSADTFRSVPAKAAVDAGADIINDVTGLKGDEALAGIVAEHKVSLILMAHEKRSFRGSPIVRVREALKESLSIARMSGISEERIVIDPGIGFFRKEGKGMGFSIQKEWPWYVWDCFIIRELRGLRSIRRPVCLGVSRKSFIGRLLNLDKPEDRLYGSLSATVLAVVNCAHVVRTHDVSPTVQAVRMAERILQAGCREGDALGGL